MRYLALKDIKAAVAGHFHYIDTKLSHVQRIFMISIKYFHDIDCVDIVTGEYKSLSS